LPLRLDVLRSEMGGVKPRYGRFEALARWHVHARTNGGLAGSYGRAGPAGRAHCSTCTGAVETTMHTYLHCPLHRAPRASAATPSGRRVAGGTGVGWLRSLESQR
jgi:hypothetical protein